MWLAITQPYFWMYVAYCPYCKKGGRRNPCFNVGMYLGEVGLLIGLILRLYRGGCSISRGKEEKALG